MKYRSPISTWLATAVLLLMFGLALTSMTQKSPTFDEQGFIVRGLGYLRGENRHMRVGHPLGLNALNSMFLVSDPAVQLPTDHPSWPETSFHRPSGLFLWEIGNPVEQIMFLARLPTIWLGMLLAAVCGRWAWEITRRRAAGLLALTLLALDPNILAHSALATTDLGLTAAAAFAGFTLWRFLKQPHWSRLIIAGAAFGLLQNTKFTAALFVPLFGLVMVLGWWEGRGAGERRGGGAGEWGIGFVRMVVGYGIVGVLTLWAAYGFDVGTLPDALPTLPALSGRTLPLAHHLEQLLDIGGRIQKSTPAFLLGQYSDQGWWYYFPTAFILKTPLPTLILLLWATVQILGSQLGRWPSSLSRLDLTAVLLPALGYFAIALTSDINLGYRHILPALPFLAVFIAATLTTPYAPRPTSHVSRFTFHPFGCAQGKVSRFSFHVSHLILPLWLVVSTLLIYPHFLAYFNPLAGGPNNGWRSLVDSNIDWGQDLAGLKQWMAENDIDQVWLSYFGTAWPEYYDIRYTGLDSFPPRLMNPEARPYYPHDPAPGIYAISASNLQGVLFQDHDVFAWFRERPPLTKIGYSIFIYEVAPYGRPTALVLAGLQLDELHPADYAQLGTNQITPGWVDPGQSWLWPGNHPHWLVIGSATSLYPPHLDLLETGYRAVATVGDYHLYEAEAAVAQPSLLANWAQAGVIEFAQGSGRIAGQPEFILDSASIIPGQDMVIRTTWRQLAVPQPVKLFIHLVDGEGDIVSQWDGLGVVWEGWRAGDTLVHVHHLPIPATAPAGTYQLWAGLYHPEHLERWSITAVALPPGNPSYPQNEVGQDRVWLGEITISNEERP